MFGGVLSGLSGVIGIITVVQWAWNSSLFAWPGTWIIAGIIAVVAVIYLLATKTQFFQTIWDALWHFMKAVASWFAGPFVNFFKNAWKSITSVFTSAKNSMTSGIQTVINKGISFVNYFLGIPGRLSGKLGNIFSSLWTGFRGTLNRIIGGWNSLHFGIPGFSFLGVHTNGISIGVPHIPYLAAGGDVLKSGLAYIHQGEKLMDKASAQRLDTVNHRATSSHAEPLIVRVILEWDDARSGDKIMDAVHEGIRAEVKTQGGGNVQVAYGRGSGS
jgi:hypothetical protein